jgi:predicted DNA-binding transcriptional regulator AlpA
MEQKQEELELVDQKGLEEMGVTYSDTHLLRLARAKKFPKPMRFGPGGKNYWVKGEIRAFIAEKLAQRDKESVS